MLTAWDKVRDSVLALPDCESSGDLEVVRERTRHGELVCPECRQPLWLRAGPIRIPHFGHRNLNECPHGRVSEAVLPRGARFTFSSGPGSIPASCAARSSWSRCFRNLPRM